MAQLPKVHKRATLVRQAQNELENAALAIQERYQLTTAEYIAILAELIQSEAKAAIRTERGTRD